MFGCAKLKENNVATSYNQTKVRQIINDLNNKESKNEKLKFLIFLNEEDFKKYLYIFPSRKDRLKNQKYNFPGELIIEKYDNIDKLNYKIENSPIPNQLYIMLPKEKLFINPENFTSRLIDSKLEELKNIFMLLKANTVKINKNLKIISKEKIEINTSINIDKIDIDQKINLENSESNINNISNKMTFLNDPNPIDLSKLEIDNYYFLNKQFDWQNMIIRRIEGDLSTDKYVYQNKEMKIFKSKFINKLKFLELSIDYDWEKFKDLKIEYDIEYFPLDEETKNSGKIFYEIKDDYETKDDEINNDFSSISTNEE